VLILEFYLCKLPDYFFDFEQFSDYYFRS